MARGVPARGRRRHRGYEQFLEALADPLHEEHDDMLVWVGFRFDPAVFSVASANVALQRVR